MAFSSHLSCPYHKTSTKWHVSLLCSTLTRCNISTHTRPVPLAALAGSVATAAYLDAKFLIRHDLSTGSLAGNVGAAVKYITEQTKKGRLLVYHLIEDHALRNEPDHLFLIFEGKTWTYNQFFQDLQRVGNWLMNDLGVKKGELVAMTGPNTPEYLMLWFALDAIGACPAFINSHLTGQPLLHSVKVRMSLL